MTGVQTCALPISRNGEDIMTATVYNSDTTFTDHGLTPGTQYTYQALWLEDGIAVDSSLNATAQTMDTTSHNFVWEFDTLGIWGSALYDVAIIDENNIWVVGEIKTDEPDTVYNLPYTYYNAAHWDGSEWELIKVLSGFTANKGIMYFSEDDIWVTSGFPIHWDGNEWTLFHLQNMGLNVSVENLWGISSSNIYFVGNNGSIVHYDGTNFTLMESGTDTPIRDIWGLDENRVWAVALTNTIDEDHPYGYEKSVLEYNGESWEKIYVSPGFFPILQDTLSSWPYSVFAYQDSLFITCNGGLWVESVLTRKGKFYPMSMLIGDDEWALNRIRANDFNDIFILSNWGQITHFNGLTWKVIIDMSEPINPISSKIFITNNLITFVGRSSGKALIVRGYR